MLAIDRNRDALLRMVAALLVMAGGGVVSVLPRSVRTEIFSVLRPAESALRRLVLVVKEVLAIQAGVAAARGAGTGPVGASSGAGVRVPSIALFDRRKCFDFKGHPPVTRGNPRVWMPGMEYPVFEPKTVPLPDDPVSAERLCRRLQALQRALGDLPKQARRLARWQAKREHAVAGTYIRPMRPGRPPGFRKRQTHPVDAVLSNCHEMALYLLEPPEP